MVAQIDANYAKKSFGKTIKRLASYSLFEGRPHTTKGQWFNPIVFAILRSLSKLPGSPNVKEPIFITGLGRSGTTILGVLFSMHRDVGFLNEPKAIWSLIAPNSDINGDYIKSNGKFRLNESDASHDKANLAHRIFHRYLAVIHSKRLVDKYPELIFRVGYLLKLFPDAHIIFITRNGADACHSINLWSQRLGVSQNDEKEDWWGRNDIKWHYLREQVINNDSYYESIRDICTDDLDHLNRAALEWIITMLEGLNQLQRYPKQIIKIKYEDLIAKSTEELTKLFKTCNLSIDQKAIDYAKETLHETAKKPWPNLHPEIDKLFRETMNKLNY